MTIAPTSNYTVTRDQIINRALRIVGAIASGESASSTYLAEASEALNQLVKEWQADGMQLWGILTSSFPLTATVSVYSIGLGQTINQTAPNKVYQAWMRDNTAKTDQPMIVITRQEYDILGSKFSPGVPNQVYYFPPGPLATGQIVGTFTLYTTPDTFTATNKTFFYTGQFPLLDMNVGTDIPDFPSYYYNALVWGLAEQLGFEYGVPIQAQGQISQMALKHLTKAQGFDMEEGSLYLQPNWQAWGSDGYGAGRFG
jgi:hypothetical protein